MKTIVRNPIQPLIIDNHDVIRFKQNKIVRALLDHGRETGLGLNEIACMEFSNDDRIQLAQLIGYSLCGFGDLSYVDDLTYEIASKMSSSKVDEKDERIAYLTEKLEKLQDIIKTLTMEALGIDPDDLINL